MEIKKTKTLLTVGLFLTPLGMILSQFNKPLGAGILGAAIALMTVHILRHLNLDKKAKKE